jgi:hypothetical protein
MAVGIPAFAIAMAACVPSAPDKTPHGGFSVRLAPTAATKGQPFTTADGWTITFTKTALRLSATGETGFNTNGPTPAEPIIIGDGRVLSATGDCELRLTALDVGDAVVKINLSSGTAQHDTAGIEGDHPCGLDPTMLARFEGVADNTMGDPSLDLGYYAASSNVAFVAEAEKNGRHVHVELYAAAFNGDAQLHSQLALTAVKANTGVPLRFPVYFETIFVQTADTQTPPAPAFETIANADANNDGTVTPDELRAVPVTTCGSASGDYATNPYGCQNLLDVIVRRMAYADTDPTAPLAVDPTIGAGGPDYNPDFNQAQP